MKQIIIFLLIFTLISCEDDVPPKPKESCNNFLCTVYSPSGIVLEQFYCGYYKPDIVWFGTDVNYQINIYEHKIYRNIGQKTKWICSHEKVEYRPMCCTKFEYVN